MKKLKFDISSNTTIIIGVIILVLAQLFESTSNTTMLYVGYVVALIFALITKSKNIILLYFFLLSDNRILDLGGVSIQLIFALIYIFKYLKENDNKIPGSVVIACIVHIFYCFIYMKSGIGSIFFTIFLSNKKLFNLNYYENILKHASIGIIFSILIAILFNPSLMSTTGRFALSADSNWNMLGILSAILFSHLFFLYIKYSKKSILLLSILMIICALVSTSRTALLVILFSFIWIMILVNGKKSSFMKKQFIFILVAIFIILILLGVIHISFIDKLINRIINPRQGDFSNGRIALWGKYIDFLNRHSSVMLFGYGSALIETVRVSAFDKSLVAHNMYIEQLVMYGIFGNITLIYLYLSSYIYIKKKTIENFIDFKVNKKYFFTVLTVFLVGLVSHLLTSVLVTTELFLGIYQLLLFSYLDSKNN